jgi:hypothetical protein
MNADQIILKLQSVRASTRSEANKQLLTECIDEIRTDQIIKLQEQEQQAQEPSQFYVRQRLKLKEGLGFSLSQAGKKIRFLVNTIDGKNKRLWVVDESGLTRPIWILMNDVEPAED